MTPRLAGLGGRGEPHRLAGVLDLGSPRVGAARHDVEAAAVGDEQQLLVEVGGVGLRLTRSRHHRGLGRAVAHLDPRMEPGAAHPHLIGGSAWRTALVTSSETPSSVVSSELGAAELADRLDDPVTGLLDAARAGAHGQRRPVQRHDDPHGRIGWWILTGTTFPHHLSNKPRIFNFFPIRGPSRRCEQADVGSRFGGWCATRDNGGMGTQQERPPSTAWWWSAPASAGCSGPRRCDASDVDVTMVAKTTHHLFQPLLYQVATGILSEGEIAPPTREVLSSQQNARVLLGEVTDIDLERKLGHLERARPADGHAVRLADRRGRRRPVLLRQRPLRRVRPRHEEHRRRPRAAWPDLRRLRDGRARCQPGRRRRPPPHVRGRGRRSDRGRDGRPDRRALPPHPPQGLPRDQDPRPHA